MNRIPITERSNPKSEDIDLLKAEDITKVLSDCEDEIFSGYERSMGIYNDGFIKKCMLWVKKIRKDILEKGEVNIILVGAGTSGRLCRLTAKIIIPIVGDKINIIPIIAGGIKALVRAEPNTEDKMEKGRDDYLSYTTNIDRSNCYVIGVSCGLSASYVKGALEEANKYSEGKTAIIGFNPIGLATVDFGKNILILNPIIGPEPIVGSVRMKGGTTTMILIYALIISSSKVSDQIEKILINIFNCSRVALSKIRNYQGLIAQLINTGNKTLQAGGSIYLLGSSSYGALCIYDAAECPPTFGAKIDQVNGYSEKGVTDLVYFPYEKGESLAKEINLNIFINETLPALSRENMLLVICNSEESDKVVTTILNSQPKNFYSIQIAQKDKKTTEITSLNNILFQENWENHFQKLLFVRSLLIHISTGSFVLSGKVYTNKMIDLRITNKKLFLRAIRIINHITHINERKIKEALLKIIYEGNIPRQKDLEDHISLSASKENVVPMTILSLIYPQKKITELKSMLRKEPIVRKLVIEELANLH